MRNAGRLIRRAPVIAGAALSFAAAFSAPALAGDESLDGYRAQGLQAARQLVEEVPPQPLELLLEAVRGLMAVSVIHWPLPPRFH